MSASVEPAATSRQRKSVWDRDSSRVVQLDVLRGIAILLVLFTHAVVGPDESGSWRPVLQYLHYLGPTGVDLFFVLSGFLVGGLLLKEFRAHGRIDVRRFLIRRGFKIWPPYFVFLAAVFAWIWLIESRSGTESIRRLLPNLIHLQNYFGSPREHTWSLAVEEHFYLALPLLLVALLRFSKAGRDSIHLLPAIALTACVLCAVARFSAYAEPRPYNPHFATHLRLDSLLFGVLLAYYYHLRPERLSFVRGHRGKLIALSTCLLLAYPAFVIADKGNQYVGTFGFIMLYMAYGSLLLVMLHAATESTSTALPWGGPVARGVAFVGYFSYPIYLWHLDASRPMLRLLRLQFVTDLTPEARWLVAFVAYGSLAIASGVFFGSLVDRPSLALREKLFPARARPPMAPTGAPVGNHPLPGESVAVR